MTGPGAARIDRFTRAGLTFPVRDGGPAGGEPVILLHGFPEASATWEGITPALHRAGCRTLAPDQRGYASTARPRGSGHYRLEHLASDVLALADSVGAGAVHVVGHDWGGAVGWYLGARHPDRLRSLAVLSTPHPRALAASMLGSLQPLRSAYIGLFKLPAVAELVLGSHERALLERLVRSSGLSPSRAEGVRERMSEPGALTAALDWYRAMSWRDVRDIGSCRVPTTYLWGTKDRALGRRAADGTCAQVQAPYRFEVLDGIGHWIQHEVPERASELLTDHLGRHRDDPRRTPDRSG